jgi:hypothetical protein
LKLLLGSKRYRPEGKLVTFIYRVATNLWIDHYRQARPRPRFHSYDQAMFPADDAPGREFDSGVATPAQLAADEEEKVALRRALKAPRHAALTLAHAPRCAGMLAQAVEQVFEPQHRADAFVEGVLVQDQGGLGWQALRQCGSPTPVIVPQAPCLLPRPVFRPRRRHGGTTATTVRATRPAAVRW